jgi:hypothetical protein
MSPARWDRLPPKAKIAKEKKARKPRQGPAKWLCRVDGCGAVIEGYESAMDAHLDAHGGGRADCIFELKGK